MKSINNKIINFLKKEIVLCVATVATLLSALLIPPSKEYFDYIDFNVLALLFCLMAVVAGFIKCGLFGFLSEKLTRKSKSIKVISALLPLLCFFFAMLVTNDVALITFVPLTIIILESCSEKRLIFVIVMETISANLGSMLTPIGNPQNLYIYSFYNMNITDFLSVTLPVTIFSLVLIIIILCFGKNDKLDIQSSGKIIVDKKNLLVYILLFLLCIITVLRIIDYRVCFTIIFVYLLIFDRTMLKKVDYALLATFVAFFILVGNISNIDTIKPILLKIIDGNELLSGVFLSQGISNVPAAIMLSHFTSNAKDLLLGVNIGGLGTLIASLASLISYKIYSQRRVAKKGQFILIFTTFNVSMLILLTIFAVVFY